MNAALTIAHYIHEDVTDETFMALLNNDAHIASITNRSRNRNPFLFGQV